MLNLFRRGTWNPKKKAAAAGVDTGADSILDISDLATVGIANNNLVKINAADVAVDDFPRFTATGVKGLSASEVLEAIGAEPAKGEDDNFVTDEEKAAIGDGKVKTSLGDSAELLAAKLRAGTDITLTTEAPTEVTMTDEQYADYAALIAGESIAAGDRFTLVNGANDTANNYLAGQKGSAVIAGDVFQDSLNATAIYLGNTSAGSFSRIVIAYSGT